MSTAPVAFPIEGRPTVARLQEQLGRARLVNANLREKLHAERRENRQFAERVLVEVVNVRRGLLDGFNGDVTIDQAANALGYAAARHIAQRSSGVL